MSRRRVGLVVDASIARASGPGDRPPAPGCQAALRAVLDAGLQAVVCEELREEWRREGSREFNRWRKIMASRKLIRRITLTRLSEYETHAKKKRRRSTGVLSALLKDLHLAVAAIETDRRVLSLDDKIRRHLIDLDHPEVAAILWADPGRDDDAAAWIAAGAPRQRRRLLGEARVPRSNDGGE